MFYRRPYKIREATSRGGNAVTVPSDCSLKLGTLVDVLSDGFIVVVPRGAEVDEDKLREAVQLPNTE